MPVWATVVMYALAAAAPQFITVMNHYVSPELAQLANGLLSGGIAGLGIAYHMPIISDVNKSINEAPKPVNEAPKPTVVVPPRA